MVIRPHQGEGRSRQRNSRDKGPEAGGPWGFVERPGVQRGWRAEHSGESAQGWVGRGLCKRFGFYFNETPLEGSVRIQNVGVT